MASYLNSAVTRPGQKLQAADNRQIGSKPTATDPHELHVAEYGGEVTGTIARKSIMEGFVNKRTIRGTSIVENFRVGESTLQKVTPGEPTPATTNQASSVSVRVDTVIEARNIVPLLDDFQSSYDASAAIGQEHGKKIAKFIDQAFLIQAIKAAQMDATGLPAGWVGGSKQTLKDAASASDPAALYAGFADLFAQMEEKDVDPVDDGLIMVTRPDVFYKLLQADQLVDTTLVTSAGNEIKAKVWQAFGVPIYRSNNLPNAAVTGHYLSNEGNSNAYDGDFSKVVACAFSPKALLAGETIPVTPKVFYDEISNAWFIKSLTAFAVTPNHPGYAGVILKP